MGLFDKFKKKDEKIGIDPSRHSYVHVLTDEIRTTFVVDLENYSESNQVRMVEDSTTTKMIDHGKNKYGERYIGTFDSFNFDKAKTTPLISRCSYDELVTIFNWRHQGKLDYETDNILDTDISKLSLLQKKFFHISSELVTVYPMTTSPNDPDYEYSIQNPAKYQCGPPFEHIGPDEKQFGDFHLRLIYDAILIRLYFLYWSTENKKQKMENKMSLLKDIKVNENFTKLPEFKMDELNNILDTIVFD